MRKTLPLVGWLLLTSASAHAWPSFPFSLPDFGQDAPPSRLTRVERVAVAPQTAIVAVPAWLQQLHERQVPVSGQQLADATSLMRPVAPRPAWREQVFRDHGAPVRRWRAVEISPAELAVFMGRHPEGAYLEIFPDVAGHVVPGRTLVSRYGATWNGTLDGDLRNAISMTYSDGELIGSASFGGRDYRFEGLEGEIIAIIELDHHVPVNCGDAHPQTVQPNHIDPSSFGVPHVP